MRTTMRLSLTEESKCPCCVCWYFYSALMQSASIQQVRSSGQGSISATYWCLRRGSRCAPFPSVYRAQGCRTDPEAAASQLLPGGSETRRPGARVLRGGLLQRGSCRDLPEHWENGTSGRVCVAYWTALHCIVLNAVLFCLNRQSFGSDTNVSVFTNNLITFKWNVLFV